MGKGRLEAFSDGVIAIIITIMVLELKVPHGNSLGSLQPLLPVFTSYVLSFINVAIYWNNHHHMLQAARQVNGKILWANVHLLFWLSLFPFVANWMGENHFSQWPVILYGFVSLMSGTAYFILAQLLAKLHGKDAALTKAIGKDRKGIFSLYIYVVGIGLAFVQPLLGLIMYILVALMWFIPDKRIEKAIDGSGLQEIEH
jgi:uncharacterized membrane protein